MTAVAVIASALVVVAIGSMLLRGRPPEMLWERWLFHNGPAMLAIVWLAHLVLRKDPRHGAGLVLLGLGAWGCVHVGLTALVDAELLAAGVGQTPGAAFVPADLPLRASIPYWVSTWLWVPLGVAVTTAFLLVFPTGRLPGPRWWWIVPTAASGTILVCTAFAITSWPRATHLVAINDPPLDTPVTNGLMLAGGLAIMAASLASVAALLGRWRSGDPEQRRQIRAVVCASAVMAVTLTLLWPWQPVWKPTVLITVILFLATYALAIARYRLHDLDLVISRAVVGAVLAATVTVIYLVLVIGIGSLVGRGSDRVLLPLVAVGVIAVLFEPVRRRVRQLVDRLIYGRETETHDVLSELAGRMSDADAADDLLDRTTGLLLRSTGAQRAEIHVRAGERNWLAASAGETTQSVPVRIAPVTHRGDTLGQVGLFARADSDLHPDADRLLDSVAGTLGVVLRNAQITAELRHQVEELRRSRERLVQVHDEARRSLERDIHDGAQARLVALRIRLGIAGAEAEQEASPRLASLLGELGGEVDAAVRSLRDLARGLRPPVLEELGIAAALTAEARRLPLEVTVEADGTGRHKPAVEAAVYFSCLEALHNAARHGGAGAVRITLANGGDELSFSVTDDGSGFDPATARDGSGLANVADRLSALGGRLEVDSAAGQGARISGILPAQPVSAR